MEQAVYITHIAKFLPNAPVNNDDMELYLGYINNKPSVSKKLILKSNGITQRYYALDRSGRPTHTSVQMAAEAVRGMFDQDFRLEDIDLLAFGTASPEYLIPSPGVMLHGELKGNHYETVSFAGSCCAGIHALKYAYMSVLSGLSQKAVSAASERLSLWMQAKYFEQEIEIRKHLEENPYLAFEKDFLRWMLSDGAGAMLLENKPGPGLNFRIEFIELCSFANELETCMYAGAEKNKDGGLDGWASFPETEWLSRSLFALRQDARHLGKNIIKQGGRFMKEIIEKRNLKPEEIQWVLPHLSSMFFKKPIMEEYASIGFHIPEERWFINLPTVGNVAAASLYLMLEEFSRSGKCKKGDKILCIIPESARFSYAFCLLEAC